MSDLRFWTLYCEGSDRLYCEGSDHCPTAVRHDVEQCNDFWVAFSGQRNVLVSSCSLRCAARTMLQCHSKMKVGHVPGVQKKHNLVLVWLV
jgi:hypothetical protein